jgi:molybdenum cofactor cytidylyltransferase
MVEDRTVGAVILAAGMSRRYGSPKQLAVVDGVTIVERVIRAASTAGLSPVVVVVPVWLARPPRLASTGLQWVRNPFPERGMSLSLRLGFAALPDTVSAAVVLLGDQPGMPGSTIEIILAARGDRPLIAALAGGVQAPPVLVERSQFGLIEGLRGDIGLRQVLEDNADLVRSVEVSAHPADLDRPADLGRISGP